MYEVAVRYKSGAFDPEDIVVAARCVSDHDNAAACSVGYGFH